MYLGIFAKTFVRPNLAATLQAVRDHGLDCVQFNLSCAGLPTLPDAIDPGIAREIGQALVAHGIRVAAISGTFNMIHPDPEQRAAGLERLGLLASICPLLGAPLITLCTGTRDPHNMWRRHPENGSPPAWRDLVESIEAAVRLADEHGVQLGIEPEVSNVVDTARAARRLLDQIGSPQLKIVMDAANLFHAGDLARMSEVLDEAFDLLGRDIGLAHAKDLVHDGEAGDRPAGTGLLDYDRYLALLRGANYSGALILHGLDESQVPAAVAFLRGKLAAQ